MRRLAGVLAFFALLFFSFVAKAAPAVDLLTVGEGNELFARYGHSVLCVREGETKTPRCFDYGVPTGKSETAVAWNAVRGIASFVPVDIEEPQVLAYFKDQGRSIDRQRLPLSDEEATKLVALLDRDVQEKKAYAYHPYYANCTTMIRDRIDEATNGKLKPGRSVPVAVRFRELAEEGHTGHAGELLLMAITLGAPNERVPNAWEAMFLPRILEEAVTERFGVAPEHVAERLWTNLPASRAAGRVFLFVIAFALVFAVRLAGWKGRARAGRAVVGVVLGALGTVTWTAAAFVTWPEVQKNWALAVLLPFDFAIGFLAPRQLAFYAKVRVVTAVVFAALELSGVIAQPMLPVAALVFMPLVALLRERHRAPAPVREVSGAPVRAKAPEGV